MNNFNDIQELLRKKADFQTRLNLIPYSGTPEIKENKSGKYLYIRKLLQQNSRNYRYGC